MYGYSIFFSDINLIIIIERLFYILGFSHQEVIFVKVPFLTYSLLHRTDLAAWSLVSTHTHWQSGSKNLDCRKWVSYGDACDSCICLAFSDKYFIFIYLIR